MRGEADEALSIDWFPGENRPFRCPVCGDQGLKPVVARYRLFGGEPCSLLQCGACDTRLLDPPTAVFFDMDEHVLRFYLEQGAGLDVMIEPVFRGLGAGARSMLEVGCGLGLALDFAHRGLGWNVRGFEPGAVAEKGSEILAVPIERRLLDETPVGEFDLVLLSEVIEHVADPIALLRAARAQLSRSGYLALSTPLGEAIHSPFPSVWMPALSPTFHLVLFSASSLRLALSKAGFTAINVERRANTLVALAGNDPATIERATRAPGFDPDVYLSYLSSRIKDTTSRALARGYAYRHLKTCVNHARYREAESSLRRLRWLYFRTCGIDVRRPSRTAQIATEIPFGSDAFHARVPYNLEGVFFFLGIFELNLRRNPRKALEAFDAALTCARHFRRLPTGLGANWDSAALHLRSDGEGGDLHRQSARLRLLALAHLEPDRAMREAILHARLDPSDDEHLPPLGLSEVSARLVALGARDAGATLDALAREVSPSTSP